MGSVGVEHWEYITLASAARSLRPLRLFEQDQLEAGGSGLSTRLVRCVAVLMRARTKWSRLAIHSSVFELRPENLSNMPERESTHSLSF